MSEYQLNCIECGKYDWVHALSGKCLDCKLEEEKEVGEDGKV